MPPSQPRSLLVVAHPGHELRVLGWLARARPRVLVLTDGSGGAAVDRRHGSRDLLAEVGAEAGSLFGHAPDRAFYEALMAGDAAFFAPLLERIAAEVAQVDLVVSDAPEGYNPVHDLCHALTALAVERARAEGRQVRHCCFPLEGAPNAGGGGEHLHLGADELAWKLAAAEAYPGLREEFEAALGAHGADTYALEVLSPAPGPLETWFEDAPYFETYGERMVAAGRYRDVLRWEGHLRPLLERLADVPVPA